MASIELAFSQDQIRFRGYRHPPAAAFRSGAVTASQIRDTDPDGVPPEVRLLSNARPIVRRSDLWGALLEPGSVRFFVQQRA